MTAAVTALGALLFAFGTFARADTQPYRLEMGLGFRAGSQMVDGKSTGSVAPVQLEGGIRWWRLFAYGEYQFTSLTWPGNQATPTDGQAALQTGGGTAALPPAHGIEHRGSLNARYSFGRLGDLKDGFGDLYVEAGLGEEQFRWDGGGTLTRHDYSFGLGASAIGFGRHHHGGYSMGFRVVLAPRNDVAGAPATCAGPCDTATPPTGWDRAFLFDMTAYFGR
ncbi:MAG TPA: hypothetical protein VGM88_28785 [Kofleriaceae bacterium]|jgi:hypothetical protein